MVKPSVPGRPTYLDNSRAGLFCACRDGLFGHFSFAHLFFVLSLSLGNGHTYKIVHFLETIMGQFQSLDCVSAF